MLLGLTSQNVKEGIAKVEAVRGRSNVLSLSDCTLIDDCYNANPGSMGAALDLLSMASGRKVAILGDMFELGEGKEQLHGDVGIYAVEKKTDVLICTGLLSRYMYEQAVCTKKRRGAGEKTEIYYFAKRDEMIRELPGLLKADDTILVKASHGMAFEKVVEFLLSRDGNS